MGGKTSKCVAKNTKKKNLPEYNRCTEKEHCTVCVCVSDEEDLVCRNEKSVEHSYGDQRLPQNNRIPVHVSGKVKNLSITVNGNKCSDHYHGIRRSSGRSFTSGRISNTDLEETQLSDPYKDDSVTSSFEKDNRCFHQCAKEKSESQSINSQKDTSVKAWMLPAKILDLVSLSVCSIKVDGKNCGTGFRVGSHYLLTAYHVLKDHKESLSQRCTALFPTGEFQLTAIKYINDKHDIILLALDCDEGQNLPEPLSLQENCKTWNDIIYIASDPTGASGRSGSPGILLNEDKKAVVTVMHNEIGAWSCASYTCFDKTFVVNSTKDQYDFEIGMTMKTLSEVLLDDGQIALNCDIFDGICPTFGVERYRYNGSFIMVTGLSGCGKSTMAAKMFENAKEENDNNKPDIIIVVVSAIDDLFPSEHLKKLMSACKGKGIHICGVMTKLDKVMVDDTVIKNNKNEMTSLLELTDDRFTRWISDVDIGDKAKEANNGNPDVTQIEKEMDKFVENLRGICSGKGTTDNVGGSNYNQLHSSLVHQSDLDILHLKQDCNETNFNIVQPETPDSLCCTTDDQVLQSKGKCRKILHEKDLDMTDSLIKNKKSKNMESDETHVKGVSRIAAPVVESFQNHYESENHHVSRLTPSTQCNRNVSVYTCTVMQSSTIPGNVFPSRYTSGIGHFCSQKLLSPCLDDCKTENYVPSSVESVINSKLDGPESLCVGKQLSENNEREKEDDGISFQLKTLNVNCRLDEQIYMDYSEEHKMILEDYFNVVLKNFLKDEFQSVHPAEEITASSPHDTDGINQSSELNLEILDQEISDVYGSEWETSSKPTYTQKRFDFETSKQVLRRLRGLLNIRDDFIRQQKYTINPAPNGNQPSHRPDSQKTQNTLSRNDSSEIETSGNQSEETSSHDSHASLSTEHEITNSSFSSPSSHVAEYESRRRPQTQMSDSMSPFSRETTYTADTISTISVPQASEFSFSSSTGTGETDPFSTSTSSGMTGLFSHLSSGSHEEVLKYEWARFRTFWSFPLNCPVNPTRLARQGWYYEGNGDETVCFCCKVKHAHWRLGDDIDAVHSRISPNCPFIMGQETGNVPIHEYTMPSIPASREQGATGGPPANARSDFPRNLSPSDHEPSSLLTRNLQLSGGGKENLSPLHTVMASTGSQATSKNIQQQTSSSSTNSAANNQQNVLSRNPTVSAPTSTSTTETATSSASRTNNTRVLAQPTSTPAIFLQSSIPSSPPVSQPPQTAAAVRQPLMDHIPGNSSQLPPNQQHPTTPRQRIEERQRQLQLAAQRRHAEIQRRQEEERRQANPQAANASALGINTERPRYPNYAIVTVRAGTFGGFPPYLDQTPMQMAKAGFFYAGYGDYVRCFFCGGGLRNWEPGDDPWVEHARWFPRCVFVKQNKGQTFINLVLQRQREMLLPNISVPTEAQPQLPEAGVPRSIDMQSSAVQSIKDMGFGDSLIERAVTQFRARRGHDTPLTAQPLLEIVFAMNNANEEAPLDIPPGNRQGETAQTQTALVQNPPSQGQAQTQMTPSQNQTTGSSQNSREVPNKERSQSPTKPPSPPRQRPQASGGLLGGQADTGQRKLAAAASNLSGELPDDDPSKVLSVEELKSIQEENIALKEQMKCKICMDNNVSISFLPCGHLCCCSECAPAMVRCPICRQVIKGSVKTFLS